MKLIRLLMVVAALFAAAGCQNSPPLRGGLTEAQIAVLERVGFGQTGDTWSLDLDGRLLFETDNAALTHQTRDIIERVALALKSVDIDRLTVEGHADNTGDARYNRELSLRRAASVARAFTAYGIPYEHIVVRGRGSERPIADNATAEGRAQNRRVVLIVPAG